MNDQRLEGIFELAPVLALPKLHIQDKGEESIRTEFFQCAMAMRPEKKNCKELRLHGSVTRVSCQNWLAMLSTSIGIEGQLAPTDVSYASLCGLWKLVKLSDMCCIKKHEVVNQESGARKKTTH
jgi:hypothetical protein